MGKKKLSVGDRLKSKIPQIDEWGRPYYPEYEIIDISKPTKNHKIKIKKNEKTN